MTVDNCACIDLTLPAQVLKSVNIWCRFVLLSTRVYRCQWKPVSGHSSRNRLLWTCEHAVTPDISEQCGRYVCSMHGMHYACVISSDSVESVLRCFLHLAHRAHGQCLRCHLFLGLSFACAFPRSSASKSGFGL